MIRKIIALASVFVVLSISYANTSYAETTLGTSYSDTIRGTSGDDIITSLAGDDRIMFSYGKDFINGGSGFDTVDYSISPVDMGVKMLKTGTIIVTSSNAFGPDDVVNNVELIIGTPLGDNFEGYKEGVKVIYQGGAGDDDFYRIDSSKIFASYSDAENGILVDLFKGSAYSLNSDNDANIGTDTFRFVNSFSVIGSNFDDKIIGNNGDNTIEGRAGNDFLDARGGNNVIDGGDGIDYCNYDPRGYTVISNCEIVNGVIQILDSDGDYIPDALDECPFDVNKKTPGINGCGVPDTCDFGTIQRGTECIQYHGGVSPSNIILIDENTNTNIDINDDQALIISNNAALAGNIKINSGELILKDGCIIFGNIESESGSVSINDCTVTGNVFAQDNSLEIINSTIKGNVNVKNSPSFTVIKNSEIYKILDIVHGANITATKNTIGETFRIMLSNDVKVDENQIGHKLILFKNDIISIISNSADYIVTRYNSQCDHSGNLIQDKSASLTC